MHLSSTPQDFLDQSLLLIQARPATTRITTTYSNPSRQRIAKQRERQKPKAATSSEQPPQATGKLTLKTYDPISGACIKFITNKVSDVGRLVGVLGKAGRGMGGLPQEKEVKDGTDTVMTDAPLKPPPKVDSPVSSTPLPLRVKTPIPAAAAGAGAAQSGTGGKAKKKKGKK